MEIESMQVIKQAKPDYRLYQFVIHVWIIWRFVLSSLNRCQKIIRYFMTFWRNHDAMPTTCKTLKSKEQHLQINIFSTLHGTAWVTQFLGITFPSHTVIGYHIYCNWVSHWLFCSSWVSHLTVMQILSITFNSDTDSTSVHKPIRSFWFAIGDDELGRHCTCEYRQH